MEILMLTFLKPLSQHRNPRAHLIMQTTGTITRSYVRMNWNLKTFAHTLALRSDHWLIKIMWLEYSNLLVPVDSWLFIHK
jgi:hypothetical protein